VSSSQSVSTAVSAAVSSAVSKAVVIFWLRRDLRLEDNHALSDAIKSGKPVLPLFIFDTSILDRLEDRDDRRVTFIHQTLTDLDTELRERGSGIRVEYGKPLEVWKKLLKEDLKISAVYTNRDYEPYALERDTQVRTLLTEKGIEFLDFKDQVIFEKREVAKDDGKPYVVFTPYSRRWKALFQKTGMKAYLCGDEGFHQWKGRALPSLAALGFRRAEFEFPSAQINRKLIQTYDKTRDLPAVVGTTHLGLHLRFGTVSIRQLVKVASQSNETWLNELIWREFFMQILWNFPHVVGEPFRPEYAQIKWSGDEDAFLSWCEGRTGVPIVDAGMRELVATGFMHNRVRMIAGSFLVKHLLIDWRWGEKFFARHLLDFELASNNGNWQWVAGCGCDAAPYFRVFNPYLQEKKFDPKREYIRAWVPELESSYPEPIVDLKEARERTLRAYGAALGK
jgi:deoxyribodipyrimidine photo-lyase